MLRFLLSLAMIIGLTSNIAQNEKAVTVLVKSNHSVGAYTHGVGG
ncbi:hypothetical protein BLGI_4672 [Brevibacillus laterosporus GI-9]|nr:hypothetical protein BLGI_4672 [Brevibacillus laterosporus GI-9]